MKSAVQRDDSNGAPLRKSCLIELVAVSAISFFLGRESSQLGSCLTLTPRNLYFDDQAASKAKGIHVVDNAPRDHGTSNANDTYFGQAITLAFNPIDFGSSVRIQSGAALFNLTDWKGGSGGLVDKDRIKLAGIYGNANSVFEYGLGESTRIANQVGVPRYAGIDSDANWVAASATSVADHFRFYLADIGPTKLWGWPVKDNLLKSVYDYQMAPLVAEPMAFDVYMVDGRFRFPCMLASFLHAAARGAKRTHTTVLLHDCLATIEQHRKVEISRLLYRSADDLFHIDHSGGKLCVFKRRDNTTDKMLFDLWNEHKSNAN
jgi:hypothetical protein